MPGNRSCIKTASLSYRKIRSVPAACRNLAQERLGRGQQDYMERSAQSPGLLDLCLASYYNSGFHIHVNDFDKTPVKCQPILLISCLNSPSVDFRSAKALWRWMLSSFICLIVMIESSGNSGNSLTIFWAIVRTQSSTNFGCL